MKNNLSALCEEKYSAYVRVLHRELIPATGCTEPIAIAYASAKAVQVLGFFPVRIKAECSGNMIKNVKSVTVPRSGGMKGIAAAAILGAVGGNAAERLNVLLGVTDCQRERAAELLAENMCEVSLANSTRKLFVTVTVFGKDKDYASVTIQDKHDNICSIIKNGVSIVSGKECAQDNGHTDDTALLNIKDIISFADSVSLDDVKELIREQIRCNSAIAAEGMLRPYGLKVGRTLLSERDDSDIYIRARAMAAAGSDARMSGCSMPVVINSGSGNQGITVSLPVIEYARETGASEDKTIRALVAANLISIHQKRFIGSLSAYCGATSAAGSAVCGIAYLDGAGLRTIGGIIVNTAAAIGGMVCDGAKPSCALKISAALNAAFDAYRLSRNSNICSPGDGLVGSSVEQTIENIGTMAKEGMRATDRKVLEIMLKN